MFLHNLYEIWFVFGFVFLISFRCQKRKVIFTRPNIYCIVDRKAVGINNHVAIKT